MNFTEYQFLKEEVEQNGLTDSVRDYIDNKFREIEEKITVLTKTSDGTKSYTVVPAGEGLLKVIDLDTLANVTNIGYVGELITNPTVHGDRVSFAAQTMNEDTGEYSVTGYINHVETGNNINTFSIQKDQKTRFRAAVGAIDETKETLKDTDTVDDTSKEIDSELKRVRDEHEDEQERKEEKRQNREEQERQEEVDSLIRQLQADIESFKNSAQTTNDELARRIDNLETDRGLDPSDAPIH